MAHRWTKETFPAFRRVGDTFKLFAGLLLFHPLKHPWHDNAASLGREADYPQLSSLNHYLQLVF